MIGSCQLVALCKFSLTILETLKYSKKQQRIATCTSGTFGHEFLDKLWAYLADKASTKRRFFKWHDCFSKSSIWVPLISLLFSLSRIWPLFTLQMKVGLEKLQLQFQNYFFSCALKDTKLNVLLMMVFTLSFSCCNTWSDQNHVGLLVCRLQDKTPCIVHWLARAYYFLLDVKKFWNRVDHRLSEVSFL